MPRSLRHAIMPKHAPQPVFAVGIHLCGPANFCVLDKPVMPVHEDRIRPYRPLPTFRPDTLVQHYLTPEEMKPFFLQVNFLQMFHWCNSFMTA